MSDIAISALTGTTTYATGDVLPIVAGGNTKKIAMSDLQAGISGALAGAFGPQLIQFSSITGTSGTLSASNDGQVVYISGAGSTTVYAPTGLSVGFSCNLLQLTTGVVTVTGLGATVNSYGSLYKIAGQHASATLFQYATGLYNLAGALTA